MSTREQAIRYLNIFEEDKLELALDYLKYLEKQEITPLDDFDYELARRADERGEQETISFDELLLEKI